MSKFNVGDKVFSCSFGWGFVKNITTSEYPVIVEFPTTTEEFRMDGIYYAKHIHPALFTAAEAKAKFPEYPAPVVKKKMWIAYIPKMLKSCEGLPFMSATNMYETEKDAATGYSSDKIKTMQVEIEVEE